MKKTMFAGAVLCAITTLVPAAAIAAGIDGTGAIPTCPATGKLKLKPAIVTDGAEAGGVKVTAKTSGVCSGGIGDGSTIVSYKVKASGTTTANTCTDFSGTDSSDLALTFKWKVAKGSPKLNPSTATFALQASGLTAGGDEAFHLTGVISAGSFVGKEVTAWFESDDLAATLLAACSGKGIKKITFGDQVATNSCLNGPGMAAAITKQITSIDSNDVPHLELEVVTVTSSPFELSQPDFTTSTPGLQLESTTSSCAVDASPLDTYRCRHTAFYVSTGACQWDGDYTLGLSYACNPTNTCDLCEGSEAVPLTLDSENFCNVNTVFCEADLSCAQATAGASPGGVPCCSDTYTPLISCLETHCSGVCSTVISGDGGIVPSSDCFFCAFPSCNATYNACSSDHELCPID